MKELLERFGGLVWSLVRRSGLPSGECEDAVQDIFADIWKSAGRFDPAAGSEVTFVATIARRRIIDRKRRMKAPTAPIAGGSNVPGVEPVAKPAEPPGEVGEDARKAAAALEALNPEQKRVLRLAVYEGLSHELISRATGLPLGTVKTHARRGLIRLRELLGIQIPAGAAGEGGR